MTSERDAAGPDQAGEVVSATDTTDATRAATSS
jgi:hypothetical protein